MDPSRDTGAQYRTDRSSRPWIEGGWIYNGTAKEPSTVCQEKRPKSNLLSEQSSDVGTRVDRTSLPASSHPPDELETFMAAKPIAEAAETTPTQ